MSEIGSKITVRQANAEDYPAIYHVVQKAFATAGKSDGDEQNLVERLRKSNACVPELSLVAEIDDTVIGHIMGTKAKVGECTVLIPAPLSVVPEHQGEGVGTALALRAAEIARDLGYGAAILIGDPRYARFGAKPASAYGIKLPHGVPDENFMALELNEGGLDGISGTIEYPKEFGLD